ncbi:MAG TPA: glycosyltransferase [Terriglobales bacterium]|nr:glycosyltransferase [Terriglobales bacterium]
MNCLRSDCRNLLLTTWEGGGTVGPVATAAAKLLARGHRVRVMSDACNRPEIEASGASFIPWKRAPSRPDRSRHSDLMRDWEAANPPEQLMRAIDAIWCGPALAYARDLKDALQEEPADLVISSEMLFGVAAACEALKQRLVFLTAGISLYPIPGMPPLGSALPAPQTAADHQAIADFRAMATALFDQGLPALNTARAALGLPALAHLFDQSKAAERLLLGTSRAFDFAAADLPDDVAYVGPQLAPVSWAAPWNSPWPVDDPRPLILLAFGTTFQDHVPLLQRIIDATADLNIRLLVTLGGVIDPGELRTAPHVALAPSAPHDEVMQQARAVITHGGHGTVLRALSHLKPLLILPLGRDQNDNAIRVTSRGAGLAVTPQSSADEIHSALHRLLQDPAFAKAAAKLGDVIRRDASSDALVQEIEATLARPAIRAAL